MTDAFEQIRGLPALREEQRIEAKHRARQNLMARLGGEPRFEDYERREIRKFPPVVEWAALLVLMLLFLAAFVVSSVHVYSTAHDITLSSQHNPTLATILGIAFVALAETAILGLALATTVWVMSRPLLIAIWTGIAGAAFITAIGNVNAVIFYNPDPFNWVAEWWATLATAPGRWAMATVPPLLTVIIGGVLKSYATSKAENRQGAKNKYDIAMEEWEQLTAQIEQHGDWLQTWANVLWDTWRKGKKADAVAAITDDIKLLIVQREMAADQWFQGGFQMESGGTKERSKGGLIDQSESKGSKAEQVRDFLKANPEYLEMPRTEASDRMGVSIGTLQRGIDLYRRNGHSESEGG